MNNYYITFFIYTYLKYFIFFLLYSVLVSIVIVKGVCPHCKKETYLSVIIECLDEKTFISEEAAHHYILENVTFRIPTENGLEVMTLKKEEH